MEAVLDNPVLQVIADRASIRAYTREPLSPAQMEALKQAALAAPTAVNAQTQRFLFVTNPALLHEVEQAVLQKILASGDEAAIARTDTGWQVTLVHAADHQKAEALLAANCGTIPYEITAGGTAP